MSAGAAKVGANGAEPLGELPWGSHFCHFYAGAEDLAAALVPYFRSGLQNHEQCLWITSEPLGAEAARAQLARAVPDLDERLERGQMEIIAHHDWYLEEDAVDPERVLDRWIERQRSALSSGYRGLRLSGNTFWVERKGWRGFTEYEARVHAAFPSHRIIALCSYSLERTTAQDMLDILRNHAFGLIHSEGRWEQIENATLRSANHDLQRRNSTLEERDTALVRDLEAALKVRDEFLSIVSHELKTPLASLRLRLDGVVRKVRQGVFDPGETLERLTRAVDQCDRLDALIGNLLTVSRVRTGKLVVVLERCDLAAIIRDTADSFAEELARRGARLSVSSSGVIPGRWDRTRLEQVLTNLIGNAIRHAPGSPVDISVAREGEAAVLRVSDHGPGIPAEQIESIFDRFAQVTPIREPGGLGLGLWICREIIRTLGGSIAVTSAPGAGATFTIVLPGDAGPEAAS